MLVEQGKTRSFEEKIANFPSEVYALGENDRLTKLMRVLLEDGVGSLQRLQAIARITENVSTTLYTDLDVFFGYYLGFPRFPDEMYSYDPFNDQLTSEQWIEVEAKDASYRGRIYKYMNALSRGSTCDGIALAAESVMGIRAYVRESWRYLDGIDLVSYPGRTTMAQNNHEVEVVFENFFIDVIRLRVLYRILKRLAPPSTLVVIRASSFSSTTESVTVQDSQSDSEFYEIRKFVSSGEVDQSTFILTPEQESSYWVDLGGEVEAPSPALESTQAFEIDINSAVQRVTIPWDAVVERPEGSRFGPWTDFEIANSPDNYPNGIRNDGVFEWPSQQAYEADKTATVLAQGGEVSGKKYRLPSVITLYGSETSRLLALPRVSVSAGWFG